MYKYVPPLTLTAPNCKLCFAFAALNDFSLIYREKKKLSSQLYIPAYKSQACGEFLYNFYIAILKGVS